MKECQALDLLITPYLDEECSVLDRAAVQQHLTECAVCRRRVEAESTAREVLRAHAAVARTLGEAPAWRPRAFRLGKAPLRVAYPAALTAAAVVALLLAVFILRPQPVAAVGTIGDSVCGAHHQYVNPQRDARSCTLGCVARGARFVFIVDGTVYEIQNQEFPDLASFADRRVEVSGHIDGSHINVSAMALAPL
jgi:hypothetical protein